MAFEELPADFAKFFETGELPATLAAEQSTATVIPDAKLPEPMHVPETKVDPVVPEVKVEPPVIEKPVVVEPPVIPPANNPFLERLLAEKDAGEQRLQQEIKALQDKLSEKMVIPAPDKTTDPLGFITHSLEKLQAELAAVTAKNAESAQQTEQQQQVAALQNHVQTQVETFVKDHADYPDAYKHLVTMRMQDFADLGLTAQQAQAAMEQEARSITQRALMTGKNPAELAYGMAKRYGYQVKASAEKVEAKVENKLETIRKGMEASTTLDRSTPPGAGDVSLDSIKNMSDAELTKTIDKDWHKLFGKSNNGIF